MKAKTKSKVKLLDHVLVPELPLAAQAWPTDTPRDLPAWEGT